MRKEERYKNVIQWFLENKPIAETELHYANPYQLLVAVILSAQCTDKRVNMVTPALFEAYPTPEAMAASNPDAVFSYIKSISYPNNKAKHLVGMAQTRSFRYQGTDATAWSREKNSQCHRLCRFRSPSHGCRYARFQGIQPDRIDG